MLWLEYVAKCLSHILGRCILCVASLCMRVCLHGLVVAGRTARWGGERSNEQGQAVDAPQVRPARRRLHHQSARVTQAAGRIPRNGVREQPWCTLMPSLE